MKIFTCGPSIYRPPHIGNHRTFLYEDILIRFLEFSGFRTRRAMNLTDVEDKSIEEARNQDRRMEEVTGDVGEVFARECRELGMKPPDALVPASAIVEETALLIKRLIDKGHAYFYRGDVFFDPLTVKDFGKLARLDLSRWPAKKVRYKKDTYPGNRWNLGDFILWHGYRGESIACWDTCLGRGRPSWNIQDPGVIISALGEQIDINCGGIDNIIRHHDYNIAVMEALTDKPFARYYLHGAHLMVNGQTMSKSRGNIIYAQDVYQRGYTPQELRFFLTAVKPYRQKLNFTWENLEKAALRLRTLRRTIAALLSPAGLKPQASAPGAPGCAVPSLLPGFIQALEDDLDLSRGVAELEKALARLTAGGEPPDRGALGEELIGMDRVLGCLGL
ncbi:MAG: class I tRNA ligase family protein [Spirochaetales bacterium]|nr:class I tRNA ligase family protein [Spirochaetales bacterium]